MAPNLVRIIVLFLLFANFSTGYKYIAIVQNDEVFDDCADQKEGELNVHGLFNVSEMRFKTDNERIFISGNATSVWNIQKTDRVEYNLKVFEFDRGEWQPTLYSINVPNFCSIMYDKHQYWYIEWLQFVKNKDAIKDNCLNVSGTKFIHEPFELVVTLDTHLNNMNGIYKLVVRLKAFNKMNVMRQPPICVEIRGELKRL